MSIPIYSLKAEEKKFLRAEFVNTPDATKSPGSARVYDIGITDSLKYILSSHKGYRYFSYGRVSSNDRSEIAESQFLLTLNYVVNIRN